MTDTREECDPHEVKTSIWSQPPSSGQRKPYSPLPWHGNQNLRGISGSERLMGKTLTAPVLGWPPSLVPHAGIPEGEAMLTTGVGQPWDGPAPISAGLW